ncbi:hypothetical protein C7410_13314 [Paraburkholderia silvatlantica]|uniref:Transmembrane protein n=1 Tax=Paraburkholderia silvatlantica TaxID=321895 RepID=A0A2V4TKI7_9BURK|nr:hypothetical protein [Paraburkholderia silvatlantica]PYE15624.1 hypothetical protein C7410_13314 [Paraburkholderia silvatlantica]
MKPLLRVLLVVDALTLLGFGVLFVLTPWAQVYDALQLVQTQPAVVGQAFGVVLLGFAWLALRAAFHGEMTVPVGRTVGHVNWIAGVLMLVWLIGLRAPRLTGLGQLVAGAVGVWLIILGLGGARLAGAVRKRQKGLANGASAQQRKAEKQRPERRDEPVTYAKPGFLGAMAWGGAREAKRPAAPVEPVVEVPTVTPAAVAPVTPRPAPVTPPPASTAQAQEARQAARDEAADAPRPPLRG